MILSTSKKFFYAFFIFAGLISCSGQQRKLEPIVPSIPVIQEEKKILSLQMGPDKTSSVFKDVTSAYGLDGVKAVHLYAVDFDHDGATDLVALDDFYSVPKFYKFNIKTKKFVLSETPFTEVVRASYLVFADFNHDGILDIIVGSLNQKSEMTQYPLRIFKGEVSKKTLTYKEMPSPVKEILPSASVSVFDYDLDGNLDLFIANWFSFKGSNPRPTVDMLYHGLGNFNFENESLLLRTEYDINRSDKSYINATPTFGSSVCDINQDGYPDILTSNSNGYYSKLWLNKEAEESVEFKNLGNESGFAADNEGTAAGRGGGNSFFSLCGDYNNDGIVDVVIGNLSHSTDPEWIDRSSILTGSVKDFIPQFIRTDFFPEELKTQWSEGDRRGVWIDYNLDGLLDLLIDNSGFPPSSRLTIFEQENDHAFENKSVDLGINILNPSGTVTIDLDNDGIMDFITGQTNLRAGDSETRVYVFKNQTKRNERGSLRFYLQGKKSNSKGISSTVYLHTNKRKYFQNVEYSYGSLPSQNEEGIYFAYNKENPLTAIVRWSNKTRDRLGRDIPLLKRYNLSKFNLKGKHQEFNLCEDGRILPRKKNCY